MNPRSMLRILPILVAAAVSGCATDSNEGSDSGVSTLGFSGLDDAFGDYWYQGQAEITSYDLEQARYGEMHQGTAVTIFVTEDLSRNEQVKLDDPYGSPIDGVKVLKLNATRKFTTGIYPYSVMTSVFTPVYRDRDPATLKVTASIQEWCGQTFVQMNWRDEAYRIRHFSYFEQEGDGDESLGEIILEDELWTVLRLNPGDLPQGRVRILPSAVHHRLAHIDWAARSATGSVEPVEGDGDLMQFTLVYEDIPRELVVHFRRDFPHEIMYWEETTGRSSSERLTTRATLKERMMIDYWTRNSPADSVLRAQLGL